MVEVELKQWGHSIGAIFPSDILKDLGLEKGDTVDVAIVGKKRIDGFGIAKGARPFEEEEEPHPDLW